MRGALKVITLEELTRYHVWELEQLLRIMSVKSLLTGVNIETFIVVVDVAGWSITQATRDTYSFFKGRIFGRSKDEQRHVSYIIAELSANDYVRLLAASYLNYS